MRVLVAVGIILDEQGRYLTAKRPINKFAGGQWEFPGGKVEANEERKQALARELDEEIGIELVDAEPITRLAYDYPNSSFDLDLWRVIAYQGKPYGKENQEIRWVTFDELERLELTEGSRAMLPLLKDAFVTA